MTLLATILGVPVPDDPLALLKQVIDALSSGDYSLAIGLVLMVGFWALKRYGGPIGKWFNASESRKRFFGFFTAGSTAIGFAALALQQPDPDIIKVAFDALNAGVCSVGLCKLVGEPFLGKPNGT